MKKSIIGIKGKILIYSTIILILTIASISGIIIYQINKKTYDNYYSNSNEQMKVVSQAINIFYDQIDKNIDMVATNPVVMQADSSITTYKDTTQDTPMKPSINGGIEQQIYEVFAQYAQSHEGTSYVYLGTNDGGYVQWPEEDMSAGYDPTQRPWFGSAQSKGGEIIRTAPYIYKGQLLTSNARLLEDRDGNVIGAIGIDVASTSISTMLSEMKIGETGYSILVHNTGIIMADGKNPENNFKTVEELGIPGLDKVIVEGQAPFKLDMNNETYLVNPKKVEGTDWIVASFMSEKELKADTNKLQIFILFSVVIILIISIIIFTFVADSITKPILVATSKMRDFAGLDFSDDDKLKKKKYLNLKDEVGDMIKALGVMRESVSEFISETASATENIASSSEQLTATSEQASVASDEIAKTISEIAKGAGDQARDTETTAINVSTLGELLEQDSEYITELNTAAEKIEEQKEEGFTILKELIDKSDKNNVAVNNVNQIILSYNESAEEIESASTMIQSIADQTNLLSLNAAIEAARAGEAGKGFAVVADEIRKLAEQSNSFTNDIKRVINELKSKSQKAIELMETTKQIVEEQTVSVQATEGKFEGIAEAIDVVKEVVTRLNDSASLMSDNKDKIVGLTQNLAAISEENAAATEETSASIEEQAATIVEIANAGESLAKIAMDLRGFIERFKI